MYIIIYPPLLSWGELIKVSTSSTHSIVNLSHCPHAAYMKQMPCMEHNYRISIWSNWASINSFMQIHGRRFDLMLDIKANSFFFNVRSQSEEGLCTFISFRNKFLCVENELLRLASEVGLAIYFFFTCIGKLFSSLYYLNFVCCPAFLNYTDSIGPKKKIIFISSGSLFPPRVLPRIHVRV
jgi:hypothetical protein